MGIKLLSLTVSILYSHVFDFFQLLLVFNFANLTDLSLWILKIIDLTKSNSCVASSFPLHLGTCHECSVSFVIFWHLYALASAYLLKVAHFSHTLNNSYHRLVTSMTHVCSRSICNCYVFLFCLLLFYQMNCSFAPAVLSYSFTFFCCLS